MSIELSSETPDDSSHSAIDMERATEIIFESFDSAARACGYVMSAEAEDKEAGDMIRNEIFDFLSMYYENEDADYVPEESDDDESSIIEEEEEESPESE